MNIGTANYVITRQIQNSNIPFKYQVNLPRNTPVGLPKAFQRKTNWKFGMLLVGLREYSVGKPIENIE